jgi:hypothetical protein
MGRRPGSTLYTQEKTAALYARLTPEALLELDKKIQRYDPNLSRGEFLERLARGTLDPFRLLRVFFKSLYTKLLSYIPQSSRR